MRILLMVPFLTMGGADRFNLNLVRELSRRGHTVSIVATLPEVHEWLPLFEALTPDITLLSHVVEPERQPAFMRDLIGSRCIDVVLVSNSQLGYIALPYLRAHCARVAWMDFLHMEEEHWHNGGYPRMSLEQSRHLDLTVVSSQHLRSWMMMRGGDADRIAVCYINIDQDIWNPSRVDRTAVRQALGVPWNEPMICCAARLVAQKRPRLMLSVLRRCVESGVPFTALIAGDGPDRAWMEQTIRRWRLTRVHMLGAVPNDQVRELLAASDLFFLPSAQEGIALALYEAMAMGVVPVAADVGGQRELVTPECGVLVPPSGDEETAYVTALTSLLTNPDRRAAMGSNARRRIVDHFRLEQMGERMDGLIRAAVRLHADAPRAAPSYEEAEQSALQAIRQAHHDRDVARLWQRITDEPRALSIPRRTALTLLRNARRVLRPYYRRLADRDGHWMRRGVVAARDLALRWIYGERR